MTAVKGHLTALEFPPDFKQWEYPPPDRLFDAPVQTVIPTVGGLAVTHSLNRAPLMLNGF
jgi:hypothetical protein